MPKFLIIRLSSIGDIIQCMGVVGGIRQKFPDAEIHWIARSDMAQTISIDARIDKVWKFNKKQGFWGLVELSKRLREERFDYVYDAHSNIRSSIIKRVLGSPLCFHTKFIKRPKMRLKRMLLSYFRISRFELPFVGVESYRKPLARWGITQFDDSPVEYHFSPTITSKFDHFIKERTITLVPSANWEMKRWPVSHWKSLIELLPDHDFVVLGGPSDHFCEEIAAVAPERVINMAGKSSIMESSYIVSQSNVVVSGDTGFMHSADLFGVPTIALIGPTAFGFPYRPTSEIMSVEMKCRPCTKDGRGECLDKTYQRCMVDITPQRVAEKVRKLFLAAKDAIN